MLSEQQIQDINKASVVHKENLRVYEQLFDKYADMAYTVVQTMVRNKEDADKLFVKIFDDIYQLPGATESEKNFCPTVLSYVYTYTLSKLTSWHIGFAKNDPRIMYNLICRLLKLKVKFKDIAFMFGETETLLKLKLKQIVFMLRYSVSA